MKDQNAITTEGQIMTGRTVWITIHKQDIYLNAGSGHVRVTDYMPPWIMDLIWWRRLRPAEWLVNHRGLVNLMDSIPPLVLRLPGPQPS